MLEVKGVSKSFPGVKALDNVSLIIEEGEVHALVGENGAGKSTLMHILAGVFQPDEGEILLNGEKVTFEDERSAQHAGIGMVFQERSLVGGLSIAENIFAGRQPLKFGNIIDFKKMSAMAGMLLEQVGLDLDPSIKVSRLSSIQQQLVEIAKALSLDARILILDEPTATITEKETDILFSLIEELSSRGISIIYISHRIQELHHICCGLSVLKDGKYQGTKRLDEITPDEIVSMMVGRAIMNKYTDRGRGDAEVILEVRDLSGDAFENVNFTLKKQEILGIAGLAGAGRTEVALALFGADLGATGEIIHYGKKIWFSSPNDAINHGIGYMTEDRKSSGLFLDMDISSNIVSANLGEFESFGFLDDKQILKRASDSVAKLRIATPSMKQKAVNLSGGNQQKLLLGRWLMKNSDILIIDEPTVGVDVGAKSEIYDLIRTMAENGTSIILISSELPELLTLCDRTVVMWQGHMTGELLNKDATEEKLIRLASGYEI